MQNRDTYVGLLTRQSTIFSFLKRPYSRLQSITPIWKMWTVLFKQEANNKLRWKNKKQEAGLGITLPPASSDSLQRTIGKALGATP